MDLKDYKSAITEYTKITLNPNHPLAFNCRGIAKNEMKNYKGAIADYSKAIENDSKYNLAFKNRGLAKNDIKDYIGAIADYTKAIENDPDDCNAFKDRGDSKSNLSDYRGAIADYSNAIELIKRYGFPEAYYSRGLLKIKIGQKDGGCMDLSKAGELGYKKAYEAIKKYCQ